jgi:hypothetical protein
VTRLTDLLNRPLALLIAAVAAGDVAYRLLLRAPLRRSLGIEAAQPSAGPRVRRGAVRVPPRPRRNDLD